MTIEADCHRGKLGGFPDDALIALEVTGLADLESVDLVGEDDLAPGVGSVARAKAERGGQLESSRIDWHEGAADQKQPAEDSEDQATDILGPPERIAVA